jgi:hypothetical protein
MPIMKKSAFLLVTVVFCMQLNVAQAPDWTRVLQVSTYGIQEGNCITADDSYIYVAGCINGPFTFEGYGLSNIGLYDMIIIKISHAGMVQWIKQFSAQAVGDVWPDAIALDGGHNIIVSGHFAGTMTIGESTVTSGLPGNDFIAKFDVAGNGLWATSFEGAGSGRSKIASDVEGNYYLLNRTAQLIRFSNSGVIEWVQNYPDKTLQAIAVKGTELFIGGALQSGSTTFGTITLTSSGNWNTGFLAKAGPDGIFHTAFVTEPPPLSSKDGFYQATGIFNHPTLGSREMNLVKSLTGSEENVLTTSVGDVDPDMGTLILTINADNTVSISGTVLDRPITATPMLENRYDPGENTFYLNYEYDYVGGIRTISETLKKTYIKLNGSVISDMTFNAAGNLILTGAYNRNLMLNALKVENLPVVYADYPGCCTFVAQCNSEYEFAWIRSGSSFNNESNDMYNFRVFTSGDGKIYEYGMAGASFAYDTVAVNTEGGQFMVVFDADGNALESFPLHNSSSGKIIVTPEGKIAATGSLNYAGAESYGSMIIQTSDWTKISSENQSGVVTMYNIKHDSAGNIYTQSIAKGYCDYFGTVVSENDYVTVLTKNDVSGNMVWLRQIFNSGMVPDFGPCYALDANNNVLCTGYFESSLHIGTKDFANADGNKDGFVGKYYSNGDFAWAVQVNSDADFAIDGITSDPDGNVVISGKFTSALNIYNDTIRTGTGFGVFLIKLDADGNYLWIKGFPFEPTVWGAMAAMRGSSTIYLAAEIERPPDGILSFGGKSVSYAENESDATVLVKLDAQGNAEWVRTYGVSAEDPFSISWPVDIRVDPSGNVYLYGWCNNDAEFGTVTFHSPFNGLYDFYITKINPAEGVVWAKAIYEKSYSFNYGDLLDIDNEGNLYAGGHFRDSISIDGSAFFPAGTTDFFVVKYSNDGSFQWIKTMEASGPRQIAALSAFRNNVLTMVGNAGPASMLGNTEILRKGGSSCIIATLGSLHILEVSPHSVTIGAQANSTGLINIHSNMAWSLESNQLWLSLNNGSGSGDAVVTLTASENQSHKNRMATVVLKGEGIDDQIVTVIQAGMPVGVRIDEEKETLAVFPNPCKDRVYIECKANGGTSAHISLTSSTGVVVKEYIIDATQGGFSCTLDVSDVIKGMYLMTVQTEQSRWVKAVVIQ